MEIYRYYITKTNLKSQRGWTDKIIATFLPDADLTKPNPFYRRGPELKLYLLIKVLIIEETTQFANAMLAASRRKRIAQQASVKKKQKNLLEAEKIDFNIAVLKHGELTKRAIDNYEQLWIERGRCYKLKNTENPDEDFIDRITMNYIKFQLTSYPEAMEQIAGKVGKREAKQIIDRKILDKIRLAYPSLNHVCDRQPAAPDQIVVCDETSGIKDEASIIGKLEQLTFLERKSIQYQRLEQSILREFLLAGKLNGTCQFCQDILPADLLKCAHIKKRCDCSAEEKRDINNVLLLCYKCDPLFEHGYIGVVDGQIIQLGKKNTAGNLLTTINSLIGRICLNYSNVNRRYFEWHRNQIF